MHLLHRSPKGRLAAGLRQGLPYGIDKFGRLDDLQQEATERLAILKDRGMEDAQIYDPRHTSVGGLHAFFLIRGEPETYNLPPNPEVPTIYLKQGWKSSLRDSLLLLAGVTGALLASRIGHRERVHHG